MAELSRRAFLQNSPALALGAGLGGAYAAGADRMEPIREFTRGGMLYRRLGHTGLYVSLLSFGSHTNPAFKRQAKHGSELNKEGQALRDRRVARAIDLGVNLIDTYENAGQWKPMARLVRTRRDKVLVSICRQFPDFVGRNIDAAARLFGHVDLYRIYVGDALAPRPAGTRKPNAWGFVDMQGNVGEWCSSLSRPYLYRPDDGRESLKAPGLRVVRGGNYADSPALLDPAFRHTERPYRRLRFNGLRLARDVPSLNPQDPGAEVTARLEQAEVGRLEESPHQHASMLVPE